ncbi:MAG: hypothetical protein WA080_02350 [Sulfuricurvum sp.]
MKTTMQKIAISVVACMVLGGNGLFAQNINLPYDTQINLLTQEIANGNKIDHKNIDTSKYGNLSDYKIGDISLEALVQTKYDAKLLSDFINNKEKIEAQLTLSKEDEKEASKLIANNTKEIEKLTTRANEIKPENSLTLKQSFKDELNALVDVAKATPTLVKYEGKLLVKTDKLFDAYYKLPIGKVKSSAETMEQVGTFSVGMLKITQALNAFANGENQPKTMSDVLDGLANLEKSLNNTAFLKDSKSAGSASSAATLLTAIANIRNEYKIYSNVDTMQKDGLLDPRVASLIAAKIDNDLFGDIYDILIKSTELAQKLPVKTPFLEELGGKIDDFKTIRDVFTNGQNRTVERLFKEDYEAEREHGNVLWNIKNKLIDSYTIVKDFETSKVSSYDLHTVFIPKELKKRTIGIPEKNPWMSDNNRKNFDNYSQQDKARLNQINQIHTRGGAVGGIFMGDQMINVPSIPPSNQFLQR